MNAMYVGDSCTRMVWPFMSSGTVMGRLFDIMLRKPQPPPKQNAFTPFDSIFLRSSAPMGPSITFHTCSRVVQKNGRSRAWYAGSNMPPMGAEPMPTTSMEPICAPSR
jgi:hypothetical protein